MNVSAVVNTESFVTVVMPLIKTCFQLSVCLSVTEAQVFVAFFIENNELCNNQKLHIDFSINSHL